MIKGKLWIKKRELKNSRNFKDIFIENDLSKNQRMLNMNLRNIVNAIGENKLEIRGGRIQPRGSRGGHIQPRGSRGGYNRSDDHDQRE